MMKTGSSYPKYKRKITPADRHKHSTVYHHHPYVLQYTETQFDTPRKMTAVPSVSVEKKTDTPQISKSRRETRKEKKTAQENELLKRLAAEPEISLGKMLIDPVGAMEKSAAVNEITMSRGTMLLLHLLKWTAVGICFSSNLRHFINYDGFSIASMSFTESAGIGFRIGAFCFVMDYICTFITYGLGHAFDRDFSIMKMHEVKSRYYLMQTAGYLLITLLASQSNTAGFVLATALNVAGIMLRFHAYRLTCRFSVSKQMLIITVNIILSVSLFLEYGHYAFSEVEEVLVYILNL